MTLILICILQSPPSFHYITNERLFQVETKFDTNLQFTETGKLYMLCKVICTKSHCKNISKYLTMNIFWWKLILSLIITQSQKTIFMWLKDMFYPIHSFVQLVVNYIIWIKSAIIVLVNISGTIHRKDFGMIVFFCK